VADGLAYLTDLSRRARWMSASEVLTAILTERRAFETAALRPRHRDSWRRLRFVVDQARAWSEATPGGLRAYLAWATFQGQEATRVAEAVLPEKDVDAVRVMTVHAAKGLEFPIVVMSGMTSRPRNARGVQLLWTDAGYAARLTTSIQTGDFTGALPVDEQMDDQERLRLLYVAATRARDHLVVSLHRFGGTQTPARLLADAGAAEAADARLSVPGALRRPPSIGDSPVAAPPAFADWAQWSESAQAASQVVAAQSASGLEGTEPEVVLEPTHEPGKAKGPRDLSLPPWSKGRYGSAVGRAVHGVLQHLPLDTPPSDPTVATASAAQCVAESVVGQDELVTALVRSALRSPVVRAAAVRQHWRETYVATVDEDGTVLEGYVDLLYRDDDGTLVVVDYKTDAIPDGALPSRVTYYTPQLLAYRRCVADATGAQVRSTVLFLHPGAPALEARVGD
jgi:ATP-dependent exoDNAse (exonuclease V) beta subunit